MKLATVATIVAVAAVVVPAGYAGISFKIDHYEQVAANTDYVTLVRWERLNRIRQVRQLSQIEWQIWCHLGRQLNLFPNGVCPGR